MNGDRRKPHSWSRGEVLNGNPTLRCSWCGRVWIPDQSLDQQGECPKFGAAS